MGEHTLKPCPFCGHKTPLVERPGTKSQSCIVACGWCGCRLESNEIGYGAEWNRRAHDPVKQLMLTALIAARDLIGNPQRTATAELVNIVIADAEKEEVSSG